MKKFMRTIALTVAAVLVFGMTVFAAGSTSTTTTDANQQLATQIAQDNIDMNYTATGAKFDGLKPDWLARARKYAADHGLGEIYTVSNITHDGPATVSFKSKYAAANGEYYMLHYIGKDWQNDAAYDPEAWVVIPITNNNGTLTFSSDSFSPFALGKGAAKAVVAPKTGEVIAISAILAMMMMAGAVVCAKKARLQK
ncbi:MAG: hypothetical protein K6F51_02730 [Acetatifactor sp.]|nr:hypothetical protein [Acetatifactor sp.]